MRSKKTNNLKSNFSKKPVIQHESVQILGIFVNQYTKIPYFVCSTVKESQAMIFTITELERPYIQEAVIN